MKRLLAFVILCGFCLAADKPKEPPQLTIEQRFELMKAQRDFLSTVVQTMKAQTAQSDAGTALDQIAAKHNCAKWDENFNCTQVAEPEKKK